LLPSPVFNGGRAGDEGTIRDMQSAISEEDLISPEPAAITQPVGTAGVARAAGIIALGNVISRVLGLARETVKSHLFGATWRVDAFQVSAVVPTQLYELLIGGMISSALVPVFSEYAAPERRHELERLAGTLLTLAVVTFAALVLLAEGIAPLIAWLLGSGFDARTLELAAGLLRVTLPAVMFLSLSGLLTGLLYALNRFTLPAFTSAVFNTSVVVAALLFGQRFGVASMALGILAGAIVQIALQAPGLRGLRLRPALDLSHPALRRIAKLYVPVAGSLVISQVAIYLSYNLASHTGAGSIAWMNYSTTLIQFPLGLVATAISVAILPTLSRQSQLAQPDETVSNRAVINRPFLSTLAHGLNLVLMLIIPATVGLFVLAHPIVALVFEHGVFTSGDTAATAQVLRFYLFGLTFAAIDQPLIFAFYARKDTLTPALVGLVCIGIYLVAALVPTLFRPLRVSDLALANSIQWISHALIMLWLLGRRLGGLRGYGMRSLIVKAIAATAVMGAATALVAWALAPATRFGHTAGNLIIVGGAGLTAVLVYGALMVILRVQELDIVKQLIGSKRLA
jgi:putative peptidoglycan lipid II flippase